ncbi:sporulation protein YpjB [Bacillus sp. 2205SS5-2]|uniref:sporulation protein YpjB n=1 Tax=Bacillus sp. 2205SS5-2 TaxID=3109031 RepID=UPI0030057316
MKKFFFAWAIIFCFVMYAVPILAEESPLSELDYIADKALEMTKAGKYEEAKKLLEYFSNEFTTITVHEQSFTMDELRIVTLSYDGALQSVNSANLPTEERIKSVTSFRLVVDALSSEYQPLWTQMENRIMRAYNEVKVAAEHKNHESYHRSLNVFLSQYSVIQPSIKLDVKVENVQRLDTQIAYIDHYRTEVMESAEALEQINELEQDLEQLFDNMMEDEADPSLWWVIITTGSIIMGTLSYVSFRKYSVEKTEKKQKKLKD